MLGSTPGKKRNEYVSDYVVFDLETTGTSCSYDAVIEISAVKVLAGCVADEFSTLVNPSCPIPLSASEINGIYDDMVADSPVFEVALKEFLDFAGDAVLVGHNIHSFDMRFLQRDAQIFWGKVIGNDYVDTVLLSRQYMPELRSHRLVDLARHFGISAAGAHRALNDCRMNQQIYEYLGREMTRASEKGLNLCPRCGQILTLKSGRFGAFWGCSGYPDCRFTRNAP